MTALPAIDAYRLWGPVYGETAISTLEDNVVRDLTPPLHGLRLLDAGCGTGRRLVGTGAVEAVGIDLSLDMLEAGIGHGDVAPGLRTMVGDLRNLPFADSSFDVTWCRLAIGHVRECAAVYAELARVTVPGGAVIVSDFHSAAHRAGHRRTFRAGGQVHEVEHHVHHADAHREAAHGAGLELVASVDARVGRSVRHFYEGSSQLERYDEQVGLPVVLVMSFRRGG